MERKKKFHNAIWIVLVLFCILGVLFPIIGLAAIVCMLAPSIYALIKGGRGWCGTYCPRGSFNDFILSKITLNKGIPKLIKSKVFRLTFLILLMSFFAVQLALAWGDIYAIGAVFVRMIIITTVITIVLGLIYKHRTWCHFCPMGTLAYYVSKWSPKKINDSHVKFDTNLCVNCKKCSKACPMSIDVLSHKNNYWVNDNDCIKCGYCVDSCPKKSLELVCSEKVRIEPLTS